MQPVPLKGPNARPAFKKAQVGFSELNTLNLKFTWKNPSARIVKGFLTIKSNQQIIRLSETLKHILNATYKNFSLFASFGYEWGKQTYNETLIMNVENADIQGSNVDKRVLTQRWEKPGDIDPLKDIKDMNSVTLPTSRFVQDENVLSLDALTLSYDFDPLWLRKIFLKTLRLEVSTNELFRLSSIKQERGTSYPFARTVNFSLRATF